MEEGDGSHKAALHCTAPHRVGLCVYSHGVSWSVGQIRSRVDHASIRWTANKYYLELLFL